MAASAVKSSVGRRLRSWRDGAVGVVDQVVRRAVIGFWPGGVSSKLYVLTAVPGGGAPSVRAARLQTICAHLVIVPSALDLETVAMVLKSTASTPGVDQALAFVSAWRTRGATERPHSEIEALCHRILEDVAPADPGVASVPDPTAALVRIVVKLGAVDVAAAAVRTIYDGGRVAAPSAAALLLAVLQAYWRDKAYGRALALCEDLRVAAPLIAEYYALYYDLHERPHIDHTQRAEDLVQVAIAENAFSDVKGAALLALDFHLRWSPGRKALDYFHALQDRILSDTLRSATVCAGLVKRLSAEGSDAAAAIGLADDLETAAPGRMFREHFKLRVVEAVIAARTVLENYESSPPAIDQAFAVYRASDLEVFDQEIGAFWRSFADDAVRAGAAFLNIRTDRNERAALIDLLEARLRAEQSFFALRIGDGESYGFGDDGFKAAPEGLSRLLLDKSDILFGEDHDALELTWWGRRIRQDEKLGLRARFMAAVEAANLIGAPNIFRLCRDARLDAPFHTRKQGRGLSHGLIETAACVRRRWAGGGASVLVTDERFNHCFCLADAERLAAAAQRVVVVGPYEAGAFGSGALSAAKVSTIQIPAQVNVRAAVDGDVEGTGDAAAETPILPDVAEDIEARIADVAAPGALVLIAAGVWGKPFAHTAAKAGAVALDLGSAIDAWAGVKSRSPLDGSGAFGTQSH